MNEREADRQTKRKKERKKERKEDRNKKQVGRAGILKVLTRFRPT